MLNRKLTALLLVGAIALGLGGASVLAADQPLGEADSQAQAPEPAQADTSAQSEDTPSSPEDEENQETSAQPGEDTPEEGAEPAPEASPDPAGTLSFANVDQRVRAGNLNYLVLEESIAQVEAIDYEELQEDLREGLNDIANLQWQTHMSGSMIPPTGNDALDQALQGMLSMSASSASQSLQSQYDALREQFDDLKDGKIQQDAADSVRQLRATQDNLVMLTQSMYIQLSELQATDAALDRGLAALDRTIQEMELRYQLGQISALTLQQTRASRTSLLSQQQTLASSAQTLTMNLESMIGADLTGSLRLSALPQVSQEELDAMDLEADLAAAREASYELYAAKKTLDDAQETYEDAGDQYNYNDRHYEFVQAQHAWQAAQYTYDGAVQSFELSFRTLYAQVKDYQQVLQAAQTALAVEQDNCAVDQLKYEQGTISKNALLTAQDDLAAAEETVATAQRNLFSAYNNYRWAVDSGILN